MAATVAPAEGVSLEAQTRLRRQSGSRSFLSRALVLNAVGLLWVIGAGIAIQVPALVHGIHLGPFDLLSQFGLLKRPGVTIHNSYVGDQIDAIMPWTTLAWTQVHQGHIPLWNPYSGLGAPLAFNWQSAPFSLPALAGYLVPVQSAYTVGVLVTVSIAGTGAFFLGRVLRLGVLGCVMAGTAFELSGPLVSWLGWPHATVMAWAGWLFGAALLLLRPDHTLRNIALFAVVLACSIYSGQPEIFVLLFLSLSVFLVVLLALNVWRDGAGLILGQSIRIAIGAILGILLAAPMALPGFELYRGSVHDAAISTKSLPLHDLIYLVTQGFDGLPINGSRMFGPWGYFYVGAYIGIIGLVLSVVGVVLRHRRREIIALAALMVFSGGVAFAWFSSFFGPLLKEIPVIGMSPSRALLPMTFAMAVLAGVGIDALVNSTRIRTWQWVGVGFAATTLGLAALLVMTMGGLTPTESSLRARSFIWPAISSVVGLAAVWGVVALNRQSARRRPSIAASGTHEFPDDAAVDGSVRDPSAGPNGSIGRRRRLIAGIALLAAETAFLITAGAPLWSSSSAFFPETAAVTTLRRDVGGSEVGMGSKTLLCTGLGIDPDVNDVFGVHELAAYDPMDPSRDFTSYWFQTGNTAGFRAQNEYCPAITTVSLARLYGVGYVLEPAGAPGAKGMKFVTHLGAEDLYRVPNSYPATLTPLADDGSLPSKYALGTAVRVHHPDPASWAMTTDASSPQVLRLRLTNVPGWQASIDGKPLKLDTFAGIMLQARVPTGRHKIELHYWPDSFNAGLILAVCSAGGLLVAFAVAAVRRKRPVHTGQPR